MRYKEHISEQELLSAADGELSRRKMARVREHLTACWTCRARLRALETTIENFVAFHHGSLDPQLPSTGGPRALLRSRLGELAAASVRPRWFQNFRRTLTTPGWVHAGLAVALASAFLLLQLRWTPPASQSAAQPGEHVTPNPEITPGAILPATREDLCGMGGVERAPDVPRPIAFQVFAAYGINEPRPRAYELDYLITPQLGGSDDIRNLWPQPYHAAAWTAHAKDALEDHLYQLVCEGNLDLATAQREIAADWVAAYKKYFETERPLSVHAGFRRDRPWE